MTFDDFPNVAQVTEAINGPFCDRQVTVGDKTYKFYTNFRHALTKDYLEVFSAMNLGPDVVAIGLEAYGFDDEHHNWSIPVAGTVALYINHAALTDDQRADLRSRLLNVYRR